MQSLLNLMQRRSEIASFSSEPVSEEVLLKILEAGISAPCGPSDGTHIIIVRDPERRKRLRAICEESERKWVCSQPGIVQDKIRSSPGLIRELDFFETAPYLLAITTRPQDPEVPYAVETAFLAVGYMLVMIKGLGLESVVHTPSILNEEDSLKLNQTLNLPEGEKIQVILPIGYPQNPHSIKPFRKSLNVYLDSFGVVYKP